MVLPDLSSIIANLCVDEIEPILYPKALGWNDSSAGGFLAPGEKLVDVVSRDYHVLESLGVDYEQMARFAHEILKAEDAKSMKPVVKQGFLSRLFRRSASELTKPVSMFDTSRFASTLISSMGRQSCPWGCASDSFGYSTYGSGQVLIREKLNGVDVADPLLREYGEAQFRSLEGGPPIESWLKEKGIAFGGISRVFYLSSYLVVTDLTPHLIATHHFFEGDASYRTDPVKLLNIVRSK